MSRRLAREFAMQLLYQMEVQKSDRAEQLELALSQTDIAFAPRDVEYIRDVAVGVFRHIVEIDASIGGNARGWKLSRLSRVDLAILRLCVYEMRFRDDIPTNVSINEAVELAKRYGAEDTGAFVNGVLAKTVPGGGKPRETTPDDTMPGSELPDDALPGSVLPDDALPGSVLPNGVLSGSELSGDALPGSVLPNGVLSGSELSGGEPLGGADHSEASSVGAAPSDSAEIDAVSFWSPT